MSWVWHNRKNSQKEPDWNAPLPDNRNTRLEYLYAWERRCRGYDLFPYPVHPEPPFTPYDPGMPQELAAVTPAFANTRHIARSYFSLQLPTDQKVTVSGAAGFIAALPGQQLGFEIVASENEIAYQLVCSQEAADGIAATARMHWPRAVVEENEDTFLQNLAALPSSIHPTLGDHSFVVEFGLERFAFLPLLCAENFTTEPLAGVLAGLGTLQADEVAGLQILFAPVARHWNEALLQVAKQFAEPENQANQRFYHRHDPLQTAAHTKLDQPLYAAVVRVFAVSVEGQSRAFELCKKIGAALGTFNLPNTQTGNALLALANHDPHSPAGNSLPANGLLNTVFERSSHRCGLLLSLPELVGLVHPPSESAQHPKLLRLDHQSRSLSETLLNAEGILLGNHAYRHQQQPVVWPGEYRNRHAYILGATRMGKSTLLLNMMTQDIANGQGICVIDPHGDLALDLLQRVTPERREDVLYLDLSDTGYPPAMGLLEARDEYERRLLCSDLLSVLKRIFASSWGDRLEHILRHAILTLLAANQHSAVPHTLRDIRPLFANETFRQRVTQTLTDPDLKAFWQDEFESYNPSTFTPLYNKLGLLLSSPVVRNIVAGREGKLLFADIIARKQILIVNLASSRIGSDNAHFLGALLVSKLQIAAMQSLRLSLAERTPFTLYVDEFQNFVVSSFEVILSEAGKAGLSLVMANQFLEQLNGNLQTAILSNVGTLCSFRVSSNSGHLLEKELAGRFTSHDLVSLSRGEAVVRVGSAVDSYDIKTCPPPSVVNPDIEPIRERSREAICRPREEVEAELSADTKRQEEEAAAVKQAAAEEKLATKKPQKRKKGATANPGEDDDTDGLPKEFLDGGSDITTEEADGTETFAADDKPGPEPEFYAVPDDEMEEPMDSQKTVKTRG